MPNLGKVCANKLYVPPYKLDAETISSPLFAIFKIAKVVAACPDEVAKAEGATSRAAISI